MTSEVVAMRKVTHAGRHYIGGREGLGISVKDRPSWLQRHLMRHLLGIEWVDEPHVVQVWRA